MLINTYLVIGTIVCVIFAYASFTGWNVMDLGAPGRVGPGGHGGYSGGIYHK